MRKECLLRANAFGCLDCFFHREMRHVPLPLQGVEHQNVQIAQQIERWIGNRAHVRAVGEFSNAEAQDWHIAMHQWDWYPRDASDFERAIDHPVPQVWAKDLHLWRRLFESILK